MTEPEFRAHVRAHGFPWIGNGLAPANRGAVRAEWAARVSEFVERRKMQRRLASWRKREAREQHRADRESALARLLSYLEQRFSG
jgi:hypothetical protein